MDFPIFSHEKRHVSWDEPSWVSGFPRLALRQEPRRDGNFGPWHPAGGAISAIIIGIIINGSSY